MRYTLDQLRTALSTLEAARHDPAGHCDVSRLDTEGRTSRTVAKPNASRGPKAVEVPHGAHGVDYLTIDLETGEIACGACAGHVDSTVPAEALR